MSSSEWETYKLVDISIKIGAGSTPTGGKETYSDSGEYALIRSQNVLDFAFSYNGLAYINNEQASKLNNVVLEEDDVLLNITGDSVARVCQVPNSVLPARVNQHVAIIRPKKDLLDSSFLKYYLLNPPTKTFLLNISSVGATRNAITKGMIEDLDITIPKLKSQQRIASILSSIDDKIELNRQINKTLETIAHTLFKETCLQKGHELSEGWRVGKLKDIIEINPKVSLKKNVLAKYVEMKDLSEDSAIIKRFLRREFSSGSKFQNGDTLLARITPCLENGKTGLVNFLEENEIGWGSTEFIVLRGKSVEYYVFVYCLSRLQAFRDFAIQSMVGSSGRQRVVESILAEFDLVIPPDKIITKFNNIVKPLFQQIFCNYKETQTLATLRDNLLPKLMKGEIKIKTDEI